MEVVEQEEAPALAHSGWNPWTDEPPQEAVERSRAWLRDVFRADGRVLVSRSPGEK